MNLIANKIREVRKLKGLTQEELAEQAKVNLRTIQRIENSENEPRGKTLDLICNALEINLEETFYKKNSIKKVSITNKLIDILFLLALNLTLMGIIGFLTLDANATINSVFAGYLLSFFIPFFIVVLTKKMNGLERMSKFGHGYIIYFFLVIILHGFSIGFSTGLFPCLLISLAVLYFGKELIQRKD